MKTKYEKLLKEVILLQYTLMSIDYYSEDAYQLIEKLIDELENQIESGNNNEHN